ncbi:hypothetical protein HIM_09825 [Hirsutella minnesotensis 3608]|uniref:Uncharacterized protein n=1 Tax=Hirsutella minnesotensis 3608 TaxID=1043627 RepID=A0A0F7ZKU7_9HYPO|nr:hypothetical protein HIM_09825 [Hirsutella minnesotensis 3608]
MATSQFMTVNRRIEDERRAKYCGTASIRVASLQFADPSQKRSLSSQSRQVDALKRVFRKEHGCRQEDSRHHVKAAISRQVLEAAAARASIPSGGLMADILPYPELEFPPEIKLECLDGHDRLAAADKVLQGSKKRWVVDLYLNNLSDELRLLLADGYDYQKKPDDGEIYIMIRQFQGVHGEENAFFENLWLARLAARENTQRLFDQLSKSRKYSAAFDALLDIPGLFGGFRLSVVHQLLGMKCDEANLFYLRHIHKWWYDVCDGEVATMRQITRETVEALQGMAPGACSTDRSLLLARLGSGSVFENFPAEKRQELWSRVCNASRRCLIPSLYTFFEDRKFLSDVADCIKNVLDVGRKDTIASRLEEIFSDTDQQSDSCIIQLSDTSFGSVAGNVETRLDLGIRQLWLAAFRNFRDLPAAKQKKDILAVSRTKADETVLYELASLASRLGFDSDKIQGILQKPMDREIAERALSTARKPGRYHYRDQEGCIQQIIAAFAAAVPVSESDEVVGGQGDIRERDQPPKRYGRPNTLDHDYDKALLFLPQMENEIDAERTEITSTFIRWSVYCAYFGTPPSIGSLLTTTVAVSNDVAMADDICSEGGQTRQPENSKEPIPVAEEDVMLALARQELELERARLQETQQQVRDQSLKLEQLQKEETSQQEKLDGINHQVRDQTHQIQDQNTRLEELRRDSILEREKLDRLKRMVELEQLKLNGMQKIVAQEQSERGELEEESVERNRERRLTAPVLREPMPEGPDPRDTEPQGALVRKQTNRGTRFDFAELLAHNPNEKRQHLTAETDEDGPSGRAMWRIDFINVETDASFTICDSVEVNHSDPSPVERMAVKYRRKGFYLFDKDRNQLNVKNCFRKVVENGSHTIVVQHKSQIGRESGRQEGTEDTQADKEMRDT